MEKKAIRVAYGEAIVKLGAENDKVVVLDADLAAATMTNGFKKAYPDRFIDCGIAEANMVDMAAGMSTMGLIPFCSTFAVFAGRSYDQIRNGVCYPKFNVKFGFSHAGITLGEDGGSHQAIEDIEAAMKGMLAPKFREAVIGHAEVRQTYKVSAIGTIAGCYVKDGKITRDASVRVLRDNIVIHEGKLGSLQRFKDAVKEVAAGYECGMSIEKFNDIKEGDIFECFVMEQIKE